MLRDMPRTASGRFRFMFLLLGSLVIVSVLLLYADTLNEPARLGGFAL
jgi:hypothetical protein